MPRSRARKTPKTRSQSRSKTLGRRSRGKGGDETRRYRAEPPKLAVLAADAVETESLLEEHETSKKVGDYFAAGSVFVDTVLTRMMNRGYVIDCASSQGIKNDEIIVIETFTIDGFHLPAEPFVRWATSHPTLVDFTNVFKNTVRERYSSTLKPAAFLHTKMKNYGKYANEVLTCLNKSGLTSTDLQGVHITPQEFFEATKVSNILFDIDDQLLPLANAAGVAT